MPAYMTGLTLIAALAVAVVLVGGLWNMLRTGSSNMSQKLMRWRVILQFVAIVVGMVAVYFAKAT